MKRYILTDAGNVLTRFKYRAELTQTIMAAFGVTDIDTSELFGVTNTAASDESFYRGLDTGEFKVYDLWERLIRRHNIDSTICSYPLFLSLWCRHLEPNEEVVKLFCKLQARYGLVLVSNGESEGVRHLVYHLTGSYGLKFSEIFISAERRLVKPTLLNQVVNYIISQGANPSDCFFVDDITRYVIEAEALGIPAYRFHAGEQETHQLEAALKAKGFEIPEELEHAGFHA